MPTATSETSTRTNSFHDDQSDALGEAHRYLVRGELASEQAISDTVQAFTELLKAMVPSIMLQPAKALDVSLEFFEHSLSLQRRFLHELLSTLQTAMLDAGSDRPFSTNGNGSTDQLARRGRGARQPSTSQPSDSGA